MKTIESRIFLAIVLLDVITVIDFAKGLAKPEDFLVRNLQGAENVISYSGYFLVNKEYNSNIYFWFSPAQLRPDKAPLLIWLQGFSYTDSENGYSQNQDDITRNLYNALIQFYAVFTKYKTRELYIAGQSYGGKNVPALAYKIHMENQNFGQRKINLKGIAVGNGFADPYNQIGFYGQLCYSFGLIDENELRYFEEKQDLSKFYILEQRWGEANDVIDQLIMGDRTPYATYFTNVTGFTNYCNVLIPSQTSQPELAYYTPYLNQPNVRRALHVGNHTYQAFNLKVFTSVRNDFMKSVKHIYEKLLDAPEKYQVLLYSGQLDLAVPYVATEHMASQIYWSGRVKYLQAKKTIWRAGGQEVLGYSKRSRNLRLLLVRNAGHFAAFDQPEALFRMINTFTNGKAFLS